MARYVNAELAPIYLNETACEQIKFMPTENVAPVVRCKDCKFADINTFAAEPGIVSCTHLAEKARGHQFAMWNDDFCSYGEQKEEKDNRKPFYDASGFV